MTGAISSTELCELMVRQWPGKSKKMFWEHGWTRSPAPVSPVMSQSGFESWLGTIALVLSCLLVAASHVILVSLLWRLG